MNRPSEKAMTNLYKILSRIMPKYAASLNQKAKERASFIPILDDDAGGTESPDQQSDIGVGK